MIQALQYKLYMMGIPIDGPRNVYCDKEAFFRNSTMPKSTLKKKQFASCYHHVQGDCVSGMMQIE